MLSLMGALVAPGLRRLKLFQTSTAGAKYRCELSAKAGKRGRGGRGERSSTISWSAERAWWTTGSRWPIVSTARNLGRNHLESRSGSMRGTMGKLRLPPALHREGDPAHSSVEERPEKSDNAVCNFQGAVRQPCQRRCPLPRLLCKAASERQQATSTVSDTGSSSACALSKSFFFHPSCL